MIYLQLPDLLYVADRVIGAKLAVRDYGLLESALARPRASVLGSEAYGSIFEKAAALVQSLASNNALVDGNKRLALGGLIAFVGVNGLRLTWSNDDAFNFVMSLVRGELDDVAKIAGLLESATGPRQVRG